MWDGVVTFMITESMALRQTAQLDPEIPTISDANATRTVHTMMSHEIGHNNCMLLVATQSGYQSLSPTEVVVFTSRSLHCS